MKKIIAFLLALCMVFAFAGCGADDSNEENNQAQQDIGYDDGYDDENEDDVDYEDEYDEQDNNNEPQSSYVKTYSVYAEQGAVVTWYDPQTGDFRYKDKCEACGQVASGEHGGALCVGEGSSYTAGYTCTNSNCSMWGKSQRVVISCSVSGEWVDVVD